MGRREDAYRAGKASEAYFAKQNKDLPVVPEPLEVPPEDLLKGVKELLAKQIKRQSGGDRLLIEVDGRMVDLDDYADDLEKEVNRLKSQQPKVLVVGHSDEHRQSLMQKLRMINEVRELHRKMLRGK